MKVVFDTNVIVSGFLTPSGPPGALVRLAADGVLVLCHDARVLSEYREVLLRPKFGFDPALVDPFVEQIEAEGFLVAGAPLARRLPDPDDEPFLEIALAAGAPLVTGNLRDYPIGARAGAEVYSPSSFVEILRRNKLFSGRPSSSS